MLISTMNDVPGYEVTEVLEVLGLTVRSRNAGSQLGAAFKSLVGGELKGVTKNLADSRAEVIQRMVAAGSTATTSRSGGSYEPEPAPTFSTVRAVPRASQMRVATRGSVRRTEANRVIQMMIGCHGCRLP